MAYDYIDQDILASALILPKNNDSFYNPASSAHTGFGYDGQLYNAGAIVTPPSITQVAVAAGLATYTALNSFTAGQYVNIQGLAHTALNISGPITFANATTFQLATTAATLAPVADSGVATPVASWYSEYINGGDAYRDDAATFPLAGLILLSPVSLVILNETTGALNLWMQFLLADSFALANNFNGSNQGFYPQALNYADGVISVTYTPDPGNQPPHPVPLPTDPAQSHMVVTMDFVQDKVYLDVAL
jgi:hypothetical protein